MRHLTVSGCSEPNVISYMGGPVPHSALGWKPSCETIAGCSKIFQEQVSSIGERGQLEATLEYVREGDTLVVTKLDRLARSARGPK